MRENYLENFFHSNKPKIILAVVVLVVLVCSYFFISNQIRKTQPPSYAQLQKECASKARIYVGNIQSTDISAKFNFSSHYSANLNACYVLIHGVGIVQTGTSDKLIDIYSNKVISDCESFSTAPSLNFCAYNGAKGSFNINNFSDYIASYLTTY